MIRFYLRQFLLWAPPWVVVTAIAAAAVWPNIKAEIDWLVGECVRPVGILYLFVFLAVYVFTLTLTGAPKEKSMTKENTPTDNTFVGPEVHEGLAKGSRNTHVSVPITQGGTAIGAGAEAATTGIAIGAGARAGMNSVVIGAGAGGRRLLR